MHAPGHTPGHTVFTHTASGVLFAGDSIFLLKPSVTLGWSSSAAAGSSGAATTHPTQVSVLLRGVATEGAVCPSWSS